MRKLGIFALVLALTGVLCACNRSKTDTTETTGMTMPTIITTEPHREDTVPGTSFHPDQDGLIGQTQDTTHSTDSTETTTETSAARNRMRLR